MVPGYLEERIQQLCACIAATDDEGELSRLCVDLQKALHEHIQSLRKNVAEFRASSKNHPPRKGDWRVFTEDSKQRVKELCDQIAKEQDRNRFSQLILELNQLLEDSGTTNGNRASLSVPVREQP